MRYFEYEVRPGKTFGIDKKKEGERVVLSEHEAADLGKTHLIRVREVEVRETTVEFRVNPGEQAEVPEGVGRPTSGEEGEGEPEDLEELFEALGDPGEPWGDLPQSLIDLLEDQDVFPEDLREMSDEELLQLDRIGPASLAKIRNVYPWEG